MNNKDTWDTRESYLDMSTSHMHNIIRNFKIKSNIYKTAKQISSQCSIFLHLIHQLQHENDFIPETPGQSGQIVPWDRGESSPQNQPNNNRKGKGKCKLIEEIYSVLHDKQMTKILPSLILALGQIRELHSNSQLLKITRCWADNLIDHTPRFYKSVA